MLPEIALPEGFWFLVGLAALLATWPFWGPRVNSFFQRLEQRRRDAELQAFYDRMNPNAHFRQTVDAINEETSAVQGFATAAGASDPRAIWENQIFATREEADAARWRHVLIKAREFYIDIDRMHGRSVRGRRGEKIGSDADDQGKR
ncbi:MAG: hypothetical protein GC190_02685 [Alphaproteobacteria bacterium]|nr:hypothetical protein [Alphaproteobacteria bacterium]